MKNSFLLKITLCIGLLIPFQSHASLDSLTNSLKSFGSSCFSSLYSTIKGHKLEATIGFLTMSVGFGALAYWKYKTIQQKKTFKIIEDSKPKRCTTLSYKKLQNLINGIGTKEFCEQLNIEDPLIQFLPCESQRNYLYLTSSRLMNFTARNKHTLMEFHKTFSNPTTAEAIEYKESLADNYKIHLMPKTAEDFMLLLERIVVALHFNPEFSEKIAIIKLFKSAAYGDPMLLSSLKANPKREVYPLIVIYPISSYDAASYIHSYCYHNFKDIQGLGISPRFNKKTNDLLYSAGGDGDYKGNNCSESPYLPGYDFTHYYERHEGHDDDMALYKPDFVEEGVEIDYTLHL